MRSILPILSLILLAALPGTTTGARAADTTTGFLDRTATVGDASIPYGVINREHV